ncbi:MAG: hypothetical protein IMW89_19395 [Ktedonobacteraceae bacterium]|nr:hypothetical protein [Ktedonobacteraceae bacterium]
MSDTQHNEQDEQRDELDNREIEIVDLDLQDDESQPAQESSIQEANANIPNISRRVSLDSHLTPAQRLRRALVTVLTVVIVLSLLLVSILPSSSQFFSTSFQSALRTVTRFLNGSQETPSTPSTSGGDFFYFQRLPAWGTFFLDGQAIPHAPMLPTEPPIQLPRGNHLIEWRGEPFSPLHCTLSIPAAQVQNASSCSLRKLDQSEETAGQRWLIAFPGTFSLQQLPAEERQQLIEATQKLLDTPQRQEQVQPGEYYAYKGSDIPHKATEPLQASLRFLLDTDASAPAFCRGLQLDHSCFNAENDCRLFCTLDWPTAGGWDVAAVIRPTWSYKTAGQPGNADVTAQKEDSRGEQQLIALHIQRQQQHWQVSFHPQGLSSFDDPNCIELMGILAANPAYRHIQSTDQSISWNFKSGTNRAAGCLATGTLQTKDAATSPALDAPVVVLLQRFGVVLAVDERAHQLWPALPQAGDAQQRLALEIAKNPAFAS